MKYIKSLIGGGGGELIRTFTANLSPASDLFLVQKNYNFATACVKSRMYGLEMWNEVTLAGGKKFSQHFLEGRSDIVKG
jgi:hypothetical protein